MKALLDEYPKGFEPYPRLQKDYEYPNDWGKWEDLCADAVNMGFSWELTKTPKRIRVRLFDMAGNLAVSKTGQYKEEAMCMCIFCIANKRICV